MCGICGLIDLRGAGRATRARVEALCARIIHRGPDGAGFFETPDAVAALGMRRLSIIDVAGSDQPLYNEDRSIALVFNGEIYNYRELRADLARRGHRFHTEGDGETLAHLYEDHGLDLFRHLRGMYAFALWDAPRRRLIAAVDHIGMKPLYLHQADGVLRFASEIKALLADPAVARRPHLPAIDTFLSFGFPIGERTLFDGIVRLMPGHVLIAEDGAVRTQRYWTFGAHVPDDLPATEADWIAHVRDRLRESVRLHLRSDVPLGLFLSGGVDSASVLALMAEAGADMRTFTVGYAGDLPDNELAQARRIAAHFGAQHTERVLTADDWWGAFDRYVYHHDEPNANSSAVSLLLLAEPTARQVKVVLTGLGGDELFSGYPNHRLLPVIIDGQARARWGWAAGPLAALEPIYPALKRFRIIGALPTYLPRLRHRLLPPAEGLLRSQSFDGLVMSDDRRARLYGPALAADGRAYTRAAFEAILAISQRSDPDAFAQALVINTWLHGNALLNADKVTMAHSLEARIPFFDPALLDLLAASPAALRLRANKFLLREAMRPLLPAFALERPKQPFSTPIRTWFQRDLAGRIEERLRDPGAFIRTWLRPEAVDQVLDGHFSGRAPQVEVVFRLLTLETWAHTFLDAQPVPSGASVI
jgi:asparagine synthase (glutamine-hydrolysing)